MTQETEGILDRRRLRRKLGLWRGLAIVAGMLALGALALIGTGARDLVKQDQIARVTVEGLITENRKQTELLKKLTKADHIKGVILFVNSPGGTTTGGEALYRNLRDLAAKKPVVAQFGTVAASAAYIAGLGTDHIVARGNSITGSVGVIMQWPELTGLLDKIGVKMNTVKSGSMKAEPSPFKPLDEENRRLLDEMIAESHKWFLGLVRDRRKVDTAAIPGLLKGRVYSGREALRYKLVDEIGGEEEARNYLIDKRKVSADLKVIDWKPKQELDWPFPNATANYLLRALAGWLGAGTLGDVRPGGLDGMLSVWHPGKR
ncbi:MAG: signal peptide peptidase SppA [Hyphomicrobiaceae bacterium]